MIRKLVRFYLENYNFEWSQLAGDLSKLIQANIDFLKKNFFFIIDSG